MNTIFFIVNSDVSRSSGYGGWGFLYVIFYTQGQVGDQGASGPAGPTGTRVST